MYFPSRFALSFAAVALVSGCASKGKVDAEPFDPVPQLGIETTGIVPDVRWTANLSADDDLIFAFSPTIQDNVLCAAGQRNVACYSLDFGELLWKNKHKGLSAGVAVGSDYVVAATATGQVIAWQL